MNTHFRPLFCAAALAVGSVAPARADWVLDWNASAIAATQSSTEASPEIARDLAILNSAMYDAIASIDGGFTTYHVTAPAPSGADQRAAVAAAANTVMGALYPALGSSFTTIYNDQLSTISDSQSKTDGINWGNQVAAQILNWRQSDGAANAASTPYTPSGAYGRWQPTPINGVFQNPPTLPGWKNVTPFVMTSASQFRPAAPPDITTAQYATAYAQVQDYGAKFGSLRTADQTAQAYYWSDQPGQLTQVAHWNQIAGHLAGSAGVALINEARVMAALNVALADAGISAWDAKYTYDTWRPISGIANGDSDPNPATNGDSFWEPLIESQATPEFVSEVSSFSGAAGAVLKHYFGDVAFNFPGDTNGDGIYDSVRNYSSITAAVQEAGLAGIYAGDQFGYQGDAGLAAGTSIGDAAVNGAPFQAITPVPEPSSMIFVALGGVLALRRRKREHA